MYAGDGTEVTIDAIAHAAGVGRQTIYRWWPSKGALAAAARDLAACLITAGNPAAGNSAAAGNP